MPEDVTCYRVFIASPGGLEQERQAFGRTVNKYNDDEALPRGVMFRAIGWEITLGGMGRPQSLINEDVRKCDYFVLCLSDWWGSSPDPHGQETYSSGTEEEYHLALECSNDPQRPMLQIVVLFKGVDAGRLRDPGQQLKEVLKFKKELEQNKTLLFETYDEVSEFEDLMRRHLGQWVRDYEGGQTGKVTSPRPLPGPAGGPDVGGTERPSHGMAPEESRLEERPTAQGKVLREAKRLAEEGKLTEAETVFARAVSMGNDPQAFAEYGHLLRRMGRLAQAEVMYERVADLGRASQEQAWVAVGYNNLGNVYQTRGDLDEAEQFYDKALKIEKKLDRQEGMGNAYGNLGLVYQTRGDLDRAEQMHLKSLEINEKLGRLEGMGSQCGNLGNVYLTRGDLDEAERFYDKALKIEKKLGRQEGMANAYDNLGLIYRRRGDLDRAEQMHRKSLEIDKKLGRQEGVAAAYGNLGLVYQRRGDLDRAEQMQRKSLEIDEKLGRQEGVAAAYANLGFVYQRGGDPGQARDFWVRSVELYRRIGMPQMVQKVQGWIDELDQEGGQDRD